MSLISPISLPHLSVQPVVSASAPHEERQYDLQPNQLVRVTVAEGGQERALLDLGHRQVLAETKVPLQSGQKLNMVVVETSPQLLLRVVEDKLAGRLLRALHLLGEKTELAPLLSQLLAEAGGQKMLKGPARQTIENVMAFLRQSPDGITGEDLAGLARLLGMDAEADLANGDLDKVLAGLKGALMQAASQLSSEDSPSSDVEKRLQNLELLQLCRSRLDGEGIQFIPLPLPFLEQGYLLAERGHPGEEGEAPPHVLTLSLQLEGLGNLQVKLLYDQQGLYARFFCESRSVADFVSSFREELTDMLTSVPLQGAAFTDGAQDPAQALAHRVMADGDGLLDARV